MRVVAKCEKVTNVTKRPHCSGRGRVVSVTSHDRPMLRWAAAGLLALGVFVVPAVSTAEATTAIPGPCPGGNPDNCDAVWDNVPEEVIVIPPALENARELVPEPEGSFAYQCTASSQIRRLSSSFLTKAARAEGQGLCFREAPVLVPGTFVVRCSLRLGAPLQDGPFEPSVETTATSTTGECPVPFYTEALNCYRFSPLVASMFVSILETNASIAAASAAGYDIGTC